VVSDKKERTTPHDVVKLWPGKSEQQKVRLAEAIVKDVMDVLYYGEESVSLAIEEVGPQDWGEKVYKPGTFKTSGTSSTRSRDITHLNRTRIMSENRAFSMSNNIEGKVTPNDA